jgi:RimJ/RimL family protein N-acetyltransferase
MPFPVIHTARLSIRDLVTSDAQRIFAYRSLPEVSRFQSWGCGSVEEIARTISALKELESPRAGTWYQLGITLTPDDELIGDCGFRVTESDQRQAEIGITLSPAYQSRGYAAEALGALLTHLFEKMSMHRVFGSVDPRNATSMRLMERVGMRKEAHFVQSLWFKGDWVDDVVFAVLAAEWSS